MKQVQAIAGWWWIRDALALVKSRFFELIFIVFGMLFFSLLLTSIPYLGPIVVFLVAPLFAVGVAQAFRDAQQSQARHIGVLFVAFRSPALRPLMWLGVLQFVANLLSLYLASLVDDGFLLKFYQNPQILDSQVTKDPAMLREVMLQLFRSFAISRVIYLPAAMLFWFAPYLIAWHGMAVGKAMFYSFFAVWRARLAFLVYLGACVALMLALSLGLGVLAGLHPLFKTLLDALAYPIVIFMLTVLNGSFYLSYQALLGRSDSVV